MLAESTIIKAQPITENLKIGDSGTPIDNKAIPNSHAAKGIARIIPYLHMTPRKQNSMP